MTMKFNDFLADEYVDREFESPFGTIHIPKGRNIYNALNKRYEKLALLAVDKFLDLYAKYENCDDILENADADFQKSIAIIIEDIRDTLINVGQYDQDYDTIYKAVTDFGCTEAFDSALDEIADQVFSVKQDVEEQREYREQRKENRGRWVGGTIGGNSINAISHQIDLTVMNLASGAAHSAVNAVGNYFTERQAKSDLEKIFKDEKQQYALIEGVFVSAKSIMFVFIKFFEKSCDWGTVSDSEKDKAQRLVNNLKCGAIGDDNVNDICHTVIELNPYNGDFYAYLFAKFGDDGRLAALADYFNVTELNDVKDEAALSFVKDNQGETEEDAIKAKSLLLEYCRSIHFEPTENSKCIKYINELIADFDLKYRTVDDVVCETREGADFSRKELPEIIEFMKDIKPLSSEPLLPYERNLLAKREEFTKRFSSEVSKKYLDLINSYLEAFNKAFCSTRVMGTVSRQQAAQDRALKYARGLTFTTLDEYEKGYENFSKFIELNLGITIDQAVEAKQYLEKQKEKLMRRQSFNTSSIGSSLNGIADTLKGFFGKKK